MQTGNVYIGNFSNGKSHGFGRYQSTNGDIYLGFWENGFKVILI